jgi:uncharacterized protein YkwD
MGVAGRKDHRPAVAGHRANVRGACAPQSARSAVVGRLARDCAATGHTAHPHTARPQTVAAPKPPAVKPVAAPLQSPAISRAASIASALGATCQDTELVPEAGNLQLIRSAVLCLINRVRAQHGETPLGVDHRLERAAEEHSQELIADNYFAHVSPTGVTPVDRIRATGYVPGPSVGYVIGENLAWGTLSLATPQAIVNAWVASPGHLANILEAQYKDTGIGVVPAVPSSLGGGQQGATYAQEFGVILG